MSDLLTNLGLFFSWCIDNMTDLFSYVIGQPALLILCVAMPVCGFAFGLLHRLIRM